VTGNGRRGLVGARTPRVEDERLLTGRGRYVDDLDPPGMLHAAFVRSPIPHGRLVGIDVSAARELPGVALVLTAADLTAEGAGPAGGADWFEPAGPEGLATPPYPPLADGKVRYAGEAVALVVADTRARAEDACELVEVEIDPLPAITGIADALDPALPPLFDDVGTNVFFRDARTYGDPDAAFARAGRVVRLRIGNQRGGPAWPSPGPARASSPTTSRTRTRTRSGPPSELRCTSPSTGSRSSAATSAGRSARRRTRCARTSASASLPAPWAGR
jgi:aerobic carbon-monoxide dehydrogenase large subunit